MTNMQSARARISNVLAISGEVLGIGVQALLIWFGYEIVWREQEDDIATLVLWAWCVLATVYLAAVVLGLNVLIRTEREDPPGLRSLVQHPLIRALSFIMTFGASIIGLTVALELILNRSSEVQDPYLEAIGVWAMLLAWSLFNWGYARVYYSKYHRATQPPLRFPGTEDPRLVDFVYLAFTNSTAFAVSDVTVLDSRMRWTIVWHTSLAFFFNALIIVLSMNTIAGGDLFS